jgi:hypothetical protein
MGDLSCTASILVSIGERSRVYQAFVTSAPATLDATSTVTLYDATLADVAVFALDHIVFDASRTSSGGRLVLVDTAELPWQRARCREGRYLFAPADAGLVGANTLQQWLWRRLQSGDVPETRHR